MVPAGKKNHQIIQIHHGLTVEESWKWKKNKKTYKMYLFKQLHEKQNVIAFHRLPDVFYNSDNHHIHLYWTS